MSGDSPLRHKKYMSRTRFEGILGSLHYRDRNHVEYYDRFFHVFQM